MSTKTDRELQELEERGRRAKELLADPLIDEAFLRLRGELFNKFQSDEADSDKVRKDLYQRIQLVNQLQDNFIAIVKTGESAKMTLMERVKSKVRNII